MKRKIFISLLIIFILLFSLCSCSLKGEHHNIQDYISELDFHADFKIAQLTDLHFSSYDNLDEDFAFIDLMYKDNPDLDLVIISGDLFTFASKKTIQAVLNHFNSKNVPFTITFGNHDEQLYVNYTYPSEYMTTLKNAVYKHYEDDLSGLSNNIINLKKDGVTQFQLFIIDSNTYTYIGKNGYNYIQKDQIEWYKKGIEYTNKERYGNSWTKENDVISSIIFQHIPLPEINDALKEYKLKAEIGNNEFYNEKPCPPLFNSGMFDVIEEYSSTKAIFFGHDHINDFSIKYKGVDFVYGVKSTDNMYNDEKMLGYRIIKIVDENSYLTYSRFHSYKEVQ